MSGQQNILNTVYGKLAAIKIANVLCTKRYCCICLENCDGLLRLDTCEAVDGGENNMLILTLKEMMEAIFDDTVLNIFREYGDHMCPACADSIKYTLSFIEKTKNTAMIFDKYFLNLDRVTINLLQLTDTAHISSVVFDLNLDVKKHVQERQSEGLKRRKENDCTEESKKSKVTEQNVREECVHTEVSKKTQANDDTIENKLPMESSTSDGSFKQLRPKMGTKENAAEKPSRCPVCQKRPCKHENYLVAFEKRKRIECPECKKVLYSLMDIIDNVKDNFKSNPTKRDVCCKTFQDDSFKKNKVMENNSKESHEPAKRDLMPPDFVDEDPPIDAKIVISEGPEEHIEVDTTPGTILTHENDLKSSTNAERRGNQQEPIKNQKPQESVMSYQKCAGCPEALLNKERVIAQNPKIALRSCLVKKDIIRNNSTQKTVRFAEEASVSVDTEIHERVIAQNPKIALRSCLVKKDIIRNNSTQKTVRFVEEASVSVDTEIHEEAIENMGSNPSSDIKLIEENAKRLLECEKEKEEDNTCSRTAIDSLNSKSNLTLSLNQTVNNLCQREVRVVLVDVLNKDKLEYQKSQVSVKSDVLKKDKLEYQKSQVSVKSDVQKKGISSDSLIKDEIVSPQQKRIEFQLPRDKSVPKIVRTPQNPVKSVQCQKSPLNKVSIIESKVIKGANSKGKLKQETQIIEINKEPIKISEKKIETKSIVITKDKNMLNSQSKLILCRGRINNKAIQSGVSGKVEQSNLVQLDKDICQNSQELIPTKEALSLNVNKEQELDLSDASTDSEEIDPNVDAIEEVRIKEKNQKDLLTYEKQRRNRTFECPECKNLLYSLKDLIAHVNKNNCKNKPVVIDVSDKEFQNESFMNDNIKILKPSVKMSTGKVHKVSCSRLKTNRHKKKRKYECLRCNIHPCKHEKYMTACVKLRGNGIVKCPECKNMLYSLSDLIAHVNKKHSENKNIIRDMFNKEFQKIYTNKKCRPTQPWNGGTAKKILGNKKMQTVLKVNEITSEEVVTEETDTIMEIEALENANESEPLEEKDGIQKNQESHFSKSQGTPQCQDPLKHREEPGLLKAFEESRNAEITEGTKFHVYKQVTQDLQKMEENRRSHECSTCKVVYNSRLQLSLHLKSTGHVLTGTTCCPKCIKRPCKHEKYLLAYEKQKGSGKSECVECKVVLLSLSHYIAHVNKDHMNNKFMKCDVCNEVVRSNFFENHKSQCKKPPPIKCPGFPIVLLRKVPTQKILKVNEPTKDEVIIEANETMDIAALEDSEEMKTPEEKQEQNSQSEKQVPHKSRQPLQCLKCDQICINEDSYMVHNLEHELLVVSEVSTEKDFAKGVLSMKGPKKTEVIEKEKTFRCGICHKTFKHKSWLRLHVKATKHVAKKLPRVCQTTL